MGYWNTSTPFSPGFHAFYCPNHSHKPQGATLIISTNLTAIGRAVTGINMKKHFKPKLRWLWAALAGVIGVCLGTGWLMFQHIPSWYRPLQIAPADVQSVRDDLVITVDQLSESMVKSNTQFERRFTQEQINAWLTILEKIWPASRNWLPAQLTEPFISIDKDAIRLAATYRHYRSSMRQGYLHPFPSA